MAFKEYSIIYREGVKEHLQKNLANGNLTKDDLIVLKEWTSQIKIYGPKYVQKERRWRDFAEIEGKYAGYRSSSLGVLEKRIIYDVREEQIIVVEVVTLEFSYYTEGENK